MSAEDPEIISIVGHQKKYSKKISLEIHIMCLNKFILYYFI